MKKVELSICAIFQNEAPYIKEWIEYHQLIGVAHFYLFNDRSQDDYLTVLQPYIDAGIVTLEDCFPKSGERHFWNQRRAYVRGLNKARGKSTWVAHIDLDEFIVPKQDNTLIDLLKRYEQNYGIVIRWKKFGTSGYWELPQDTLMIECLTKTSPEDHEDNFITKSIIRIDALPHEYFDEDYVVSHAIDLVHFSIWENYDGHKARSIGYLSHAGRVQICLDPSEAQINHYWCRDEKYYRDTKVVRKARLLNEDFNCPFPWPEEKIEKYLKLFNSSEDFSIQRWIAPLKKRMKYETN